MSGATLCRQISEIKPDVKVIACTRYNTNLVEKPPHGNDFAEYLEKPVDKQTMAEAIRRVLDG